MRNGLEQIARNAGKIILDREAFRVEEKEGHANYVTTIDQHVQEYLENALLAFMPGSVVIGEEKENDALGDEPTWIIDPVDGTTNLIHDFRLSSVSIALLKNKKPVLGVVYQPYTDELFSAEAGKGCFLNGKPVHTAKNDLKHALVGFGTSPYNEELAQKSMDLALTFLRHASDIRRTGSAAIDLAYVACGRQDVFFEWTLKPWDYAAGALLVMEAGGTLEMPLSETGMDFGRPQAIVAANGVCSEDAMKLFRSFC